MKRPPLGTTQRRASRSGSSFETPVELDKKDAEKRRRETRVVAKLQALERSDGGNYRNRAEADADLKTIWKRPRGIDRHNDIAVALAWSEQWEPALAEIEQAIKVPGADQVAKQRADANRDRIRAAQEEART